MDKSPKEPNAKSDAKTDAKDAGKTKDAVKQLQNDVRELQTLVAGLVKVDSAKHSVAKFDGDVSDDAVAELGAAFASAQKVALLRALEGGDATAATLGDSAHLSTGSLYHHLRDLTHAHLVAQNERGFYALTPRGVKILSAMLTLAAES